MSLWQKIALGGSLALAASAGVFASIAFSAGSAQTPQRTVTVSVANGATGATGSTGPQGPPGPAGPAGPGGGAESCPGGSTFGKLVIIVKGQGPTSILTCLVDE